MSNIVLFESKNIRRVWNESEEAWYFSIVRKNRTVENSGVIFMEAKERSASASDRNV